MWYIQPKTIAQPLSIKEVPDELEISKDDCYRAMSTSKDDNFELYFVKATLFQLF